MAKAATGPVDTFWATWLLPALPAFRKAVAAWPVWARLRLGQPGGADMLQIVIVMVT